MIVAVVQARLASTRLPGKVLADIEGEPMLWHIIRRLRRAESVERIVVAVPQADQDRLGPVIERARGEMMAPAVAEDDVLGRYAAVARATRAKWIVRQAADNPCLDPVEVDRIVAAAVSATDRAAWSNIRQIAGSGYPDGVGAEVYPAPWLAVLDRLVRDAERREHPHLIFERQRSMRTVPCPAPIRRPDLCLDVNTAEDLAFIRSIYAALHPANPCFDTAAVIAHLDAGGRP